MTKSPRQSTALKKFSIRLRVSAEETAADPSAPFMPEALAALAALRSNDHAAFEALRLQLKKSGCRVTALDDAIAEENRSSSGRAPSQTDILLRLAEAAELFHTDNMIGFADININGHRETWRIGSSGFRHWLTRCYFAETGGAPSREAMSSALNAIEAKARFDGPERQVYIRVGELDSSFDLLPLCDGCWWWNSTLMPPVVDPPVRFRTRHEAIANSGKRRID